MRYLTPMEVLQITWLILPLLSGGIIEMDELEEVVEGIFKFAGITVRKFKFIISFPVAYKLINIFSPAWSEDARQVCSGCQELP